MNMDTDTHPSSSERSLPLPNEAIFVGLAQLRNECASCKLESVPLVTMEQRVNVKFSVKLGKSASETLRKLKIAYEDECLLRAYQVYRWYAAKRRP